MFIKDEISVFDFVFAISEAVDLASPSLNRHHKKVAYIACRIAEQMNLPDDEIRNIALAAILHDIGAFSLNERALAQNPGMDHNDIEAKNHAMIGYRLLKNFEPLEKVAVLIRHHHVDYNKSARGVPIGAYVLHLADRVSVLYDENQEILEQVPAVLERLASSQQLYHPQAFAALSELAKFEYFWIEAYLLPDDGIFPHRLRPQKELLNLETLRGFAKVFAQVIDFRSHFTATHSSGIAAVALELTSIAGFSERECKLMEIAGFLHDLGKLAVSNDVLEKHGKLDHKEFNVMRKHTYYTYIILRKIKGLEQIAEWAAFHHERLDGNGYPFHVQGNELSLLSRIMAVADIFTAITEDRPYREGMSEEKTIGVLTNMASRGAIDKRIVDLVKENFHRINDVRMKAQDEAMKTYHNFHGS